MQKQAAKEVSPRLTPGDWLSVAVVLSLLMVVGVPTFLQAREWIADSTCDANRLLLIRTIRRYHQETGIALQPGQPVNPVLEQLVQRGYLRTIPREPADGKNYEIRFETVGAGQGRAVQSNNAIQVRVTCPETNHLHGSDHAPL